MRKTFFYRVRYLYNSRLFLIIQSIITGLITGLVVAGFRILLEKAQKERFLFYQGLKDSFKSGEYVKYWPLIAVLIAVGLLVALAAKFRPLISGSGVPEVKGFLQNKLKFRWLSELPLKWVCTVIVISLGVSLGQEGPCVIFGAYSALALITIFKRGNSHTHTLVCAGSAAGLSAAFSAPLAGVLFVMEEIQLSVQPLFVACIMGASIAADLVVGFFFGLKPVFDFRSIQILPPNYLPYLVLLGVICAALAFIFKELLKHGEDFYKALRIPKFVRIVIPLLLTIPACIYLFDISSSGYELIGDLTKSDMTLKVLTALLVFKMLYTGVSFGSGAPGGIFLPYLSCGALTGLITFKLLFSHDAAFAAHELNFMILGMAGFFSAGINAPVTAIILVLEMTANMNHLINLVFVCFSALVASEIFFSRPIYTIILDRIVRNLRANNKQGQEKTPLKPPLGNGE